MEDYKSLYIKLSEEFQTYQNFAENQMQVLNDKNMKLEKTWMLFLI